MLIPEHISYLIDIIMKTKSLIVLVTSVVIAMITCSFTMKSDTQWITVSGYVDNTNGDVISQVDVTCTLNRDNTQLSKTQTDPEGYFRGGIRLHAVFHLPVEQAERVRMRMLR